MNEFQTKVLLLIIGVIVSQISAMATTASKSVKCLLFQFNIEHNKEEFIVNLTNFSSEKTGEVKIAISGTSDVQIFDVKYQLSDAFDTNRFKSANQIRFGKQVVLKYLHPDDSIMIHFLYKSDKPPAYIDDKLEKGLSITSEETKVRIFRIYDEVFTRPILCHVVYLIILVGALLIIFKLCFPKNNKNVLATQRPSKESESMGE
ncbi:MAG: hypothetical protein P9L99_03710 [Candidatus Lernaella stagnicola]|nr:hypothetical protein [Candidatus Lernaella stagnicola]